MATPTRKFMLIGKAGKVVHVVTTKANDLKQGGRGSECQQVRKAWVAGKIDPKHKGMSPDAALALDCCTRCETAGVAKSMIKPDKAERAAKRDEVLERAKGKPAKKSKPAKMAKGKESKADKPKAERKEPKPTKAKSGFRSVGSSSDAKAEALRAFCADNGWAATLGKDDTTGHVVVIAHQGTTIINAFFIDGKYDVARHAFISVGSWKGTLRGAHAVRRQVDSSLDDRDRPHPKPGVGRSAPRAKAKDEVVPEDESPEDAAKRVPFLMDDDDDTVLAALLGKTIRWRNGVSGNVEEARIPVKANGGKRAKVTLSVHPKSGKRILDFISVDSIGEHGEVYGPERAVRLDRIIRVVDA
jgi:hypothetical protein